MSSLLSRYADCAFWLARYFERAESLARILEVHTSFQRGRTEGNSWAWIVALYSDEKAFYKAFGEATAENVIQFYATFLANPSSILSVIRAARENARGLRPLIPTDMWYQLNDFYNRLLAFSPADFSEMRLSRTCDAIKRGCYAQIGIAESTLYRDETWPFFRLGLFIERADQTSRLLDVRFAQRATGLAPQSAPADDSFWAILLRSASAYHSFRRIHPRAIDADKVARFMIFDSRLPRSIAFCTGEIQLMINNLRASFRLRHANKASEQVEIILSGLEAASRDPQLIEKLHNFNDWIQSRLMELSGELGYAFFGVEKEETQTQTQTQTQSQTQSQGAG